MIDTCAKISSNTEFDSNVAKNFINKYKNELNSKESLFQNFKTKYQQLLELKETDEIPILEKKHLNFVKQFESIDNSVQKLINQFDEIEQAKSGFKDELKMAEHFLNENKNKLVTCDNYSGDIFQILKRLNNCKNIQKTVEDFQSNWICKIQNFSCNNNSMKSFIETDFNTVLNRFQDLETVSLRIQNKLKGNLKLII